MEECTAMMRSTVEPPIFHCAKRGSAGKGVRLNASDKNKRERLSLCTGIFKIRAPPAKTKLLSVKFELGPLHICWKFSNP